MSTMQQDAEVDTLAHLEERIQRAVALVNRLREERAAALKELADTQAAWEESQTANMQLTEELDSMKSERTQVRSRIEKLLGHIDELGTS